MVTKSVRVCQTCQHMGITLISEIHMMFCKAGVYRGTRILSGKYDNCDKFIIRQKTVREVVESFDKGERMKKGDSNG